MKLIVLYREDGRIVALCRVSQSGRDDAGIPIPRSGVEPGEGQRVAIVELEASWQDLPLAIIHQRCTVVTDGDRVRLHDHGERGT